jgi:hypothetical protein
MCADRWIPWGCLLRSGCGWLPGLACRVRPYCRRRGSSVADRLAALGHGCRRGPRPRTTAHDRARARTTSAWASGTGGTPGAHDRARSWPTAHGPGRPARSWSTSAGRGWTCAGCLLRGSRLWLNSGGCSGGLAGRRACCRRADAGSRPVYLSEATVAAVAGSARSSRCARPRFWPAPPLSPSSHEMRPTFVELAVRRYAITARHYRPPPAARRRAPRHCSVESVGWLLRRAADGSVVERSLWTVLGWWCGSRMRRLISDASSNAGMSVVFLPGGGMSVVSLSVGTRWWPSPRLVPSGSGCRRCWARPGWTRRGRWRRCPSIMDLDNSRLDCPDCFHLDNCGRRHGSTLRQS